MPANLNALIRYRTIDKCLSNPYRKWTIEDLMEACSKALEENRGIYSGISKRTIREDIRVMRSDMLGFNAPIVQKEGFYSYGERDYSIFKVSIRDAELLERVLRFILELRSEVNHPDMDEIIKHILEAIPGRKDLRQEIFPEKPSPEQPLLTQKAWEPGDEDEFIEEAKDVFSISGADQAMQIQEYIRSQGISWSMILDLI